MKRIALFGTAIFFHICDRLPVPMNKLTVRLSSDLARVVFPPFFFYSEVFRSGRVGAVRAGQERRDLESALMSDSGKVTQDTRCSAYRDPSLITGTSENLCFRTRKPYLEP